MKKIILASTSPRRKELLALLEITYTVVASGFVEEDVDPNGFASPRDYVAKLAYEKAQAVAPQYPNAIIIGVDTMVYRDGEYFGKPTDVADARRILLSLRGKTHQVFTGVCMLDTAAHQQKINTVETLVTFTPFSTALLEDFLVGGDWEGKAGAYAIQGGANKFVQSVEGSLSNVIGLPLREVADMLEQLGVESKVDVDDIICQQLTHKPAFIP